MARLSTAVRLAGAIAAACLLYGQLATACSTSGVFSISDSLNGLGVQPVFDTSGGIDNGTLLLYSVRIGQQRVTFGGLLPATSQQQQHIASAMHMQAIRGSLVAGTRCLAVQDW
jgi:hypothetical protein